MQIICQNKFPDIKENSSNVLQKIDNLISFIIWEYKILIPYILNYDVLPLIKKELD